MQLQLGDRTDGAPMPIADRRLIRHGISRIFVARRSIRQAFYERLFDREPASPCFWRRRFVGLIALIAKRTSDPEAVRPVLLGIGRRYRSFGARPRALRVIAELMHAQSLKGLSPDEAAAWERSFGRASNVVKLALAVPVPVES